MTKTMKTLVIACVLLGLSSNAFAQSELFVGNYAAHDVTVYPRAAGGSVAPTRTMAAALTSPHQIALDDVMNELFVVNNGTFDGDFRVAVYDSATGALKRTVAGPATGLNRPIGVALDGTHHEMYVTNDAGGSITVYDVAASGNAAPLRTIAGALSGLANPAGIALDAANDELIVVNYSGSVPSAASIAFFDRLASGNVAPKRTIAGAATGLFFPQGVVLDAQRDEVIVANSFFSEPGPGAILAFARTASGNAAPVRTLTGPSTALCHPIGVALDSLNGELVVANSRFSSPACAASVTAYVWPSGVVDQPPVRTIPADSMTGVSTPISVAISDPPACLIDGVVIANASWNAFAIPSGTSPVVWVNAHVAKVSGIPTDTVSRLRMTGGSLSINGNTFALPDGMLTFDPAAPATITTKFNVAANRWETLVNPKKMSDEIFFSGAAIPVTPPIAAAGTATWKYDVVSSVDKLGLQWRWSAAAYTVWPADWNGASIQPYHAGYHAGTPLNPAVQAALIQGPRGGAGSNYTGGWTSTGKAACMK